MPTARLGPMSIECTKSGYHKAMERLRFRDEQWRRFERALEFEWADVVITAIASARQISRGAMLAILWPEGGPANQRLLLRQCVRDIEKSCQAVGFVRHALVLYQWYSNQPLYVAGPLLDEYLQWYEWDCDRLEKEDVAAETSSRSSGPSALRAVI